MKTNLSRWAALAMTATGAAALNPAAAADANPHVLWYDKPAAKWQEALPIGNGRLGAMIVGQFRYGLLTREVKLAKGRTYRWNGR